MSGALPPRRQVPRAARRSRPNAWYSSLARIAFERQALRGMQPQNPPHTAPRGDTFNFLALPRELRDKIYSYIVGKNADFPRDIYDSVKPQACYELQSPESPRQI
ncbi:hypothetical protein BU26DRAFT_221731 [Trematosphaeria pertusa]|uniref:F-box domain-containing protein n=1 Tax=Trematosphaeria pertusa TaxID=390896 RepID=A0A6A6IS63_9PLEO|nr:uncharacterized protein BU26DRAFT_221731 [Trematosphaeria pertusa]KAF2253385.1 hypothetical protein BU26DRAFT_221731 [Trematosphaeria pertusa]